MKGRCTNIFPALRDPNRNIVTDPKKKATLFRQKFLPDNAKIIIPEQPDDPLPRETRTWAPLSKADITQALKTALSKSAPGPSGVRYTILKWAHATCPSALTEIFNLYLDTGIHPWNNATVIVINKPQKPDYSLPKVYRPISLLECTGKLLEKIVANKINEDILTHNLLPMGQFGSRPHHNAVDTVTTLVHCIQNTRSMGDVGALLLFDISGFF
jgi:hypothetical protein